MNLKVRKQLFFTIKATIVRCEEAVKLLKTNKLRKKKMQILRDANWLIKKKETIVNFSSIFIICFASITAAIFGKYHIGEK